MKRNFFQITFNISFLLLFVSILCFSLNVVFNLTNPSKEIADVSLVLFNKNFSTTVITYIHRIAILTSSTALSLIAVEVISRIRKDSLLNYAKSIYQTFRMRYFLKQYHSTPTETTVSPKGNHYNPILKSFNYAVSKCVVDIRKEKTIVLLNVPNTQQAQKLLEERIESIQKEITSRHPHYYFSAPNRIGNKLWFIGTRR
ncbi:hypothetical protein ACPTH1_03980 [Enterococcus faecalis]|nr:hypothetical protein [uncultured Lactococcus sp.]EME3510561.1 hypothetical protein [Enterococcus faecium]